MTEQQSLSTAPAQGSEGLTVALHIGAPFTDEDQLVWSLRKDAGRLLKDGVLVRRPGTYMKELTDLKGRAAKADVSEEDCGAFLDGVLREADASRVVLSMSSILGVPAWIAERGAPVQECRGQYRCAAIGVSADALRVFPRLVQPGDAGAHRLWRADAEGLVRFCRGYGSDGPALVPRWSAIF
ncbi:hypothetical protein [Phaeobacter inhibens]|uniref:hypothetical protein n=1 Tax=Phaeobacter inhibens TaxID=221822 RepID=UPI0021A2AA8D|nr:hypothetical protein [Phaeobacter inhibens]